MPATIKNTSLCALLGTLVTPTALANPVLEETLVTAQKRTESLQDVSVAVSVMSGEQLEAGDITSLEEMSFYIPSYYQGRSILGSEARIRGIGSASNTGFEQSVGMFIDDIYMGRARQTLLPLFDLNRVEVIKGPQSTLFGKNTIAGAISMYSAAPTDETEGRLAALYGTDDQQRFEGAISGSLSDTVRGRLAALSSSTDGYIDNKFDDDAGPANDQWGLRGLLEWDASEELTVRLKLESAQDKVKGAPHTLIINTQLAGPGQAPLFSHLDQVPPQYFGVDDSDAYKSDVGNSIAGRNITWDQKTEFNNALIHLDYQLGEHTLTAITGYTDYDVDDEKDLDVSPVTLINGKTRESYEQWSQEVRLTSPVGEIYDYLAGVYLQSSEYDEGTNRIGFFNTNIGLPAIADGYRLADYKQDTDTASAFAMLNWHILETLSAKLGLRYTYEKKTLDKTLAVTDADGRVLVPGTADDLVLNLFWQDTQNLVPYVSDDKRTENHWTPQVIVEWYPDEDAMVYASYTKGAKSGGWDTLHVNGDDLESLEYEDESVDAYEIGIKTSLWDQRATLNAALFHTTIDDLQVSQFDGAVGFNVSNAAKATSQGAEMEFRMAVTERLQAAMSATYLDYSYDNYEDAPCTQAQFNTLWLATGSTSDCTQDLQGEPTVQAPDWSGTVSGSYYWTLPANRELRLAMDANYRGSHHMAADLDPNIKQDSVWLLNAQVALTSASGDWRLALIGKNLTDEEHHTFAGDAPLGNGTLYGISDDRGSFIAIPAPPRSYAVELTWHYF